MFELFEDYDRVSQSLYHFAEWDYVKRNMLSNLQYTLDRLHNRVYTQYNHHVIINLLNSIGLSLDTDLDTYIRVAEERLFFLTFSAGLTSSSSHGQVFNGIFYGPNVKEIIIVDQSDFNYREYMRTWKWVDPLQVKLCPVSDFSFIPPDGDMNSSAEGVAVITLNIRKLLFVYYMWVHENIDKYKKDADSVLLGLHHLMKMIILPNMLITQIDMVIMNRLMNYYYGSPMSKPFNRLPFTVKDLTHRVDSSLKHILEVLGNLTYTYPSLLKSIPAITMTNMYDYLMMPDIPLTRQVNWTYAVARSSIFRFVIELGGVKDVRMNKNIIVNARININLLETEHVLKTRLPTDLYGDVSEDLDYIKESINMT